MSLEGVLSRLPSCLKILCMRLWVSAGLYPYFQIDFQLVTWHLGRKLTHSRLRIMRVRTLLFWQKKKNHLTWVRRRSAITFASRHRAGVGGLGWLDWSWFPFPRINIRWRSEWPFFIMECFNCSMRWQGISAEHKCECVLFLFIKSAKSRGSTMKWAIWGVASDLASDFTSDQVNRLDARGQSLLGVKHYFSKPYVFLQ